LCRGVAKEFLKKDRIEYLHTVAGEGQYDQQHGRDRESARGKDSPPYQRIIGMTLVHDQPDKRPSAIVAL
jgi:hypothetical protein